ncbi:hypothetical protein [Streptomyces zaomyceticus]|uniref:hypothetical protein n=1 Tax=Streptomyces zaomyceticus TaxID=68286 RepID=UPI0036B95B17
MAHQQTHSERSRGYDSYLTTAKRLDPDEIWILLENVPEDNPEAGPAGIPATLAEAVQEWLRADTQDEGIAVVIGWNVEYVRRHREYA